MFFMWIFPQAFHSKFETLCTELLVHFKTTRPFKCNQNPHIKNPISSFNQRNFYGQKHVSFLKVSIQNFNVTQKTHKHYKNS